MIVVNGFSDFISFPHCCCHPDFIGFSNMAFYAERLIARTRKSANTDGILYPAHSVRAPDFMDGYVISSPVLGVIHGAVGFLEQQLQ